MGRLGLFTGPRLHLGAAISKGKGGIIRETERTKKILIVDNNDQVRLTLQQVLEKVGFDTRTTWSGREALALLKSQEFDVLLLADFLPDLHSSDFLSEVGKLPVQPWIVIMQTSMPTTNDLRQYASLGAVSVVRKHHIGEVSKAVGGCYADEPLAKTCVN
jgi:CheY-like chemotaxis protein